MFMITSKYSNVFSRLLQDAIKRIHVSYNKHHIESKEDVQIAFFRQDTLCNSLQKLNVTSNIRKEISKS